MKIETDGGEPVIHRLEANSRRSGQRLRARIDIRVDLVTDNVNPGATAGLLTGEQAGEQGGGENDPKIFHEQASFQYQSSFR